MSSGQFKGNSRARQPNLRFSYDWVYLRDKNGITMQQVQTNQLNVSINEIVQQLRKQRGYRIFQWGIAMRVGYSQDAENPKMRAQVVETHRYLLIAFSMQGSQLCLGNTKVSRKASQVPVLYPVFKGFFLVIRELPSRIKQFANSCPTCPGVVDAGWKNPGYLF